MLTNLYFGMRGGRKVYISSDKNGYSFSKLHGNLQGAYNRGYGFSSVYNPLEKEQPVMYLTSMDDAYMTLAPPLTNSQPQNVNRNMTAWNNFLSGTNTNTLATSEIYLNSNPANTLAVPAVSWNDNVITLDARAIWTWGAASTLNFVHNPGGEFTMYFVVKNFQFETTGTTKILLGNANNSAQTGFHFLLGDSGTQSAYSFRVFYSSSGNALYTLITFPAFERTLQMPMAVYSIRIKDPNGNVGDLAGCSYINGMEYQEIYLLASPVAGNASNVLRIGGRPSGDLTYRGYVGDIIISNTCHSPEKHSRIVDYLKLRHGII